MITLDIETDGLDPTRIWCVVTQEEQERPVVWYEEDQDEFYEYVRGKTIIAHNGIAYDIPVLRKLWKIDFQDCTFIDTLVLSRLYNPSIEGGHSLKKWGERLKFPKGEYNDWSKLTPEMVEYCKQDVAITRKLYDVLTEKLSSFGTESIDLEHQVQGIITGQIRNGWKLDIQHATSLVAELQERQNEIEHQVHNTFKPLPTFVKSITPKRKKDNTLSIVGLKFLGEKALKIVGGAFSRIEFTEFNLGSRQQIGRYLQHFGWKPVDFTANGNPIVDETTLEKIEGIPEASLIAEYLMVQKRIAQVTSWLEAVGDDGRVHGYVNTLGAVTNRMTHNSPNVAQVPANRAPYGLACRSCWGVEKGYKLVGADAAGLELRMLAHYMNDEDYTHEVLHGDIHTANQRAAGLSTRDQAKTFIYAFLYGAGDAKIGSIVGGSSAKGRKLKEQFLENTPALRSLRERIENAGNRGFIRGLDGRRIWIRSTHAALNTLLQSAGAIVMKKALTILDEHARIYGIDYKFVGNIHDEFQAEVREDQAKTFGWLAVESIKAAGIQLNLRCPLDGDYSVGDTWAQTH